MAGLSNHKPTVDIQFAADGLRLKGTLHLPAADNPPVVIGCHGLLSDRSSPKQIALAEACNALGLAFFRFDHRGCGESAGRLEEVTSLEGRASDLLHAIRLLESRPGLGKRIGLFGSSMGGAVCLRVAGERQVAAVVTFAAPVRSLPLKRPARGPKASPESRRMAAVLREAFELGGHLGRVRNILVVHGEADDVVPLTHAHEIVDQAGEPKRLLVQKGGDHIMSDATHQAEFIREASLWLSNGLKHVKPDTLSRSRIP
ncbi:MAG TPA: alpha/beta hydrolase [Desulfobacterales bacterium]|nr:alpha/beta hydrolase [Desulfobacterales bacterium]